MLSVKCEAKVPGNGSKPDSASCPVSAPHPLPPQLLWEGVPLSPPKGRPWTMGSTCVQLRPQTLVIGDQQLVARFFLILEEITLLFASIF